MTNNLRIWSSVEKTDPNFTKGFSRGGGFKGTATNATYLAKRATEMFGPAGIGWGVKLISEEILAGAPIGPDVVERIHKVHVCLWYVLDGQRGEIEQFGQTVFVGKNKNGFFTDDEAPKKSMTDAMTKALSLLGFAADIHMGRYDDNRYLNDLRNEFAKAQKPPAAEPAEPDESAMTYVRQARETMATIASVEGLRSFWAEDSIMRSELFSGKDDPLYIDLRSAYEARGKALAAMVAA